MNIPNQVMNLNANVVVIPMTPITYPYQDVPFEKTVSSEKSVKNHRDGGRCCCCSCGVGIKGAIINIMIMSIITIILSISAKYASLSSMDKKYKNLKDALSIEIEREDLLYEQAGQQNIFRFEKFWYQFEDFESKIIIADIVCPIIFIIFLIIEIVIYSSFLKKETKSGFLRTILIFFNFLFEICFKILFILLIYVFAYSLIVINMNPYYFSANESIFKDQEETWDDKKIFERNCSSYNYIGSLYIYWYYLLF